MTYLDLLQQSPTAFILLAVISIGITIGGYSAFPLIFARVRQSDISKKKYRWICFGVNFIIAIIIKGITGDFNSDTYINMSPYFLWTGVFSSVGLKKLREKQILIEEKCEHKENQIQTPKNDWICEKCGATNPRFSQKCKDCGKYR